MDVQPTFQIRPGYEFNVLADRNIVFSGVYLSMKRNLIW